jgi:hypothetical protein
VLAHVCDVLSVDRQRPLSCWRSKLTRRRHPDFSSKYVVRIGYEILEMDERLMGVEFGR